jgi:DNA-binding response OmpR family regulator
VRILVIDDDVDGADALAVLLTQSGHDVEVAYGGTQALGLSVALAAEAAIVDLTMPGMDGFEVARRLRHAYGASLRLIALSGHDDDATKRLVEIDFDGYLRKPASLASISKALQG